MVRQHRMLDLQDVNRYNCMIVYLKLSGDWSWRRPPGGDNELAIICKMWWRQVVERRTASLNSTRCRRPTGNQCTCCKTHLRVPVSNRAAAFCTARKHRSRMSEMPYRREVAVLTRRRDELNAWTIYLSWPHQPTPIARPDVAGAGSSMLPDTRSWHASISWEDGPGLQVHNDVKVLCCVHGCNGRRKNDAKVKLWESETLWCVTECALILFVYLCWCNSYHFTANPLQLVTSIAISIVILRGIVIPKSIVRSAILVLSKTYIAILR